MRTLPLIPAILLLIVIPAPAGPPATVAVNVVKYDGLSALIKQQRGKVVVVDFWADYCVPCKREFPHLVELQQKYGGDGLVAVSVALDPSDKPESRERVLKFLEARQATFTNLFLDEPADVWQERLKI